MKTSINSQFAGFMFILLALVAGCDLGHAEPSPNTLLHIEVLDQYETFLIEVVAVLGEVSMTSDNHLLIERLKAKQLSVKNLIAEANDLPELKAEEVKAFRQLEKKHGYHAAVDRLIETLTPFNESGLPEGKLIYSTVMDGIKLLQIKDKQKVSGTNGTAGS